MISLLKEHFKANHINAFNLYLNPMMLQQYNQYWMHIGDDIKTSNSPAIIGDGIILGQSGWYRPSRFGLLSNNAGI